ncbi:Transcription initiation factor TFIID subunit 12 [Chytridiales sp. JEL 0842]|nr:Transcription initiation factor TFIID subunit 12 [Chytridiales sp. JEL 0842]
MNYQQPGSLGYDAYLQAYHQAAANALPNVSTPPTVSVTPDASNTPIILPSEVPKKTTGRQSRSQASLSAAQALQQQHIQLQQLQQQQQQQQKQQQAALFAENNDPVMLAPERLRNLLAQIDPIEKLDGDVEEMLMEVAQDFIKDVTTMSCKLAKHRGSDTLEVPDAQLPLDMHWKIKLPGFGEDIEPFKGRRGPTRSHQTKATTVKVAIRESGRGRGAGRGRGRRKGSQI